MTLLERGPLLAELTSRLGQARRGGGHLVLLAGEAGIGKSALIDAFIDGLPRGSRVLRGGCDPIVPPRPFAPLHDMARHARHGLGAALASGDRDRVFERFLAEVQQQGAGGVVVLEDLHWVDAATLDVLRILGRRLAELPTLVVASYRANEIDADHPLHLALGDIPSQSWTELSIPPLTADAVAILVTGTGLEAASLHVATGGNPFYVTEVVAAPGGVLPATVRDAVAARMARLSLDAREVLRACAILGPRVEILMLDAIFEGRARVGLAEALARGMVHDTGDVLEFRHELARRAVLDAIRPRDRAELHRRALEVLRSGVIPVDAVRLANHAVEAGDAAAIAALAPAAAEQAARLGAHDNAADYLAVALALPNAGDPATRARLLERYATACSLTDRIAAARTAQESALEIWRQLGDARREGDGLRALATYMWLGGEGDRARRVASEAVDRLERLQPPGRELAEAYAKLAQLTMNAAQDDRLALKLAARAADLAGELGEEAIAVHALTTLGALEANASQGKEWARLDEALRRARTAELSEDVARILINYLEAARDLKRYDLAEQALEEVLTFLRDHEFGLYRDLARGRSAQIAFERGRWSAAEAEAEALLEEPSRSSQVRARALEVLGRLRGRRGESDAMATLDRAFLAVGPGELQDLCPLLAARAEVAWLQGDVARAGDEAERGVALAAVTGAPFWYSELSFWAWQTGRSATVPAGTEEPYRLHVAGRHRAAADAWAAIGLPYQQAAALADSDSEDDLRTALSILDGLGARALGARVRERLRTLGAPRIPRGPRPSTRAHAAGLTAREVDVLDHLRRGARNAEIAEALVVSEKTVDHHVSAILRKLGVPDRGAARLAAERLGLQDGGSRPPD